MWLGGSPYLSGSADSSGPLGANRSPHPEVCSVRIDVFPGEQKVGMEAQPRWW